MAALLTTEKGNTDKLVQYVNECRRWAIQVLPPDVQPLRASTSPSKGTHVRFGLSAIKNVGEGRSSRSSKRAERLGRPFRSIFELAGEIDLRLANKRVFRPWPRSGALDSFGARRCQLHAAVDAALEWGQKRRTDRESEAREPLRRRRRSAAAPARRRAAASRTFPIGTSARVSRTRRRRSAST